MHFSIAAINGKIRLERRSRAESALEMHLVYLMEQVR